MKNLKKIVFGLLAMLVMVTSVNAADLFDYSVNCAASEVKDGKLVNGVCTLQQSVSSIVATIDDNITIKTTAENTLTFASDVTIARGKSVVIDGGVILKDNLTLNEKASLKITGATEELVVGTAENISGNNKLLGKVTNGRLAVTLTGNKEHVITVDHATLEVSGNDKAFISTTSNPLKIVLKTATLKINDNNLNAMNGGTVEAESSTIETNNNKMGGFNATLSAKYGSTLTATGNGFAGVTLQNGSNIEAGSKIIATDNLKGNSLETVKREVYKADLTFRGDSTVNGTLEVGSMGPEKDTSAVNCDGEVLDGTLKLSKDSKVSFSEIKTFCAPGKYTEMDGCQEAKEVTITAADGDYALVKVGEDTYLYTAASYDKDIVLDDAVANLVVTKESNFASLTVAAGTVVTNETAKDIYVQIAGSDSAVKVPAAKADEEPVPTTVGTKPAEQEPNPEDGGVDVGTKGDVTLSETDKTTLEESLEANKELQTLFKDKDVKVELEAKEVAKETVAKEELAKFEKVVAGANVVEFYDLNILVTAEGVEGVHYLKELSKPITLTIDLPELTAVADGYTRKYYIIREHNGVYEKIDATLNDGKLTFATDKFSKYAIAYVDEKATVVNPTDDETNENPSTLDSIVSIVTLAISSLGTAGYSIKKFIRK